MYENYKFHLDTGNSIIITKNEYDRVSFDGNWGYTFFKKVKGLEYEVLYVKNPHIIAIEKW